MPNIPNNFAIYQASYYRPLAAILPAPYIVPNAKERENSTSPALLDF
jgi:hypothetical protein